MLIHIYIDMEYKRLLFTVYVYLVFRIVILIRSALKRRDYLKNVQGNWILELKIPVNMLLFR